MVWVVFNIVVGMVCDFILYNLWLFEILMFGGFSVVSMVVLVLFCWVF